MPIFEFRCESCRDQFELLVRGSEHAVCPACGSHKLNKLLSSPSAHVKGGGLPVASACPPSDAPPCHPNCCRLP